VVVLGIAIAAQGDPKQRAKEFAEKHHLSFPVLVDAENKVAEAYGVEAVPTNVVIGKDGTILYYQAGFDPDGIRQALEKALKE
jgi:peroxiredoxin